MIYIIAILLFIIACAVAPTIMRGLGGLLAVFLGFALLIFVGYVAWELASELITRYLNWGKVFILLGVFSGFGLYISVKEFTDDHSIKLWCVRGVLFVLTVVCFTIVDDFNPKVVNQRVNRGQASSLIIPQSIHEAILGKEAFYITNPKLLKKLDDDGWTDVVPKR